MIPMLISLVLLASPAPNEGEPDGSPGGQTTTPTPATEGGSRFISNEVGMSMILPPQAVITTTTPAQEGFFVVRDGGTAPRWSLRLESVPANDPSAEAMIHRLMLTQASENAEQPGSTTVLEDRAFPIDAVVGHMAWVQETLGDGKEVVFGWMVVPQGRIAGQLHYLVATAITLPQHLAVVRPELEQALASITIRGPVLATLEARVEAEATRSLLGTIDPARLRELDGRRSYRRVYRPGPPGEASEEVAYSIFELSAAPMGAIQVRKSPTKYTPDEREEGLLVRIHSRVVADASRQIYLDMLGLYWVAWDLSHEAWTAHVTRRQRAATRTEKEFGTRSAPSLGEPRSKITVIKQDDEINLREPYEWETPEPWMPRPLSWILGLLLPRDEPLKMSYAFFDHRHTTPKLGSRRDEWSPRTPGDSVWELKTWLDDSGLPAIADYGPEGLLIQRNPDGLMIETSDPAQIQRYWDQAGLETR